MPKDKSDATNCKTSERIVHDYIEYCCLDFRDADQVLKLFGYSAPKYYIRGVNDRFSASIDYCPWCTKQIPWKEKI